MVIQFLVGGTASFLKIIAVYITGVDVTFPRFTPENVTAIVQWGAVALIIYSLLTVILRLLICVMNWVFWVVKTFLVVLLFSVIATDENASKDTTAIRLFGLVLGCVLLTLGSERSSSVDRRLSCLEARLKAVEKTKTE